MKGREDCRVQRAHGSWSNCKSDLCGFTVNGVLCFVAQPAVERAPNWSDLERHGMHAPHFCSLVSRSWEQTQCQLLWA